MARKDYLVGSGNVFEDLGHPRRNRAGGHRPARRVLVA